MENKKNPTNNVNSVELKAHLYSCDPITPHNEALYEAGKEVLKYSISISRDFCKHMITVSMGAIPIYLGLLEVVSGDLTNPTLPNVLLIFLPPVIFLVSAVVFILGYLPQYDEISLDIVEEIKRSIDTAIARRRKLITIGVLLFMTACSLAIISVILHMLDFKLVAILSCLAHPTTS